MKRILCLCSVLAAVAAPVVTEAHEAHHHHKPSAAQQIRNYLFERDPGGGPTRAERLGLGLGAAAVASAGVMLGGLFGVVAVFNPDCLDEQTQCVQRPPTPDFSPKAQLDGRLRGQRRMLLADVSFVAAAALSLVAVAALVSAVWPYSWWPMAGG